MAWSTPATVATGELATAAWANQYIRDQFNETAPAKIAAAGDLPYGSAANTVAALGIGTALQLLRTNAGATAPEWANAPLALSLIAHASGQYHIAPGLRDGTPGVTTVSLLTASPIAIPIAATYDRIAIRGNGTGGNVRLGIWEDNAGVPGALVVAGAEQVVSAATVEATISESLSVGVYWIGGVFSASPSVYPADGQALLIPTNWPSAASHAERAFSYAALPDPFGAITTYSASRPMFALRKA